MYLKTPVVLLALVEGSLLAFAPYLAASGQLEGADLASLTSTGQLLPTASLFAVLGVLSLFAVGLHSTRQRSGRAGVFIRIVAAMASAAGASALFYYVFPSLTIDRGLLFVTAVMGVLSCVTTRLLFERIIDENLFKRRVLVFGAGKRARSLLDLRPRSDTRGFQIVGFVPSFLERETGRVRLDVLNPSWIIFGDGFQVSPLQRLLERGVDLVASAGLLAFTLPLMALSVAGIKLEDGARAPVLYRQRRVGQHGEVFEVLKFRSIVVEAEKAAAHYATRGDSRVTRMGGFMRRTRIDELPQLLNVLRGDMSFAGPRPERPEFVCQLEEKVPYYRERHSVKPGITGWAQLCYPYGSSETDAVEKLQYDLYYVKNRSLLFDLAILIQTVEVVLWGKGAR